MLYVIFLTRLLPVRKGRSPRFKKLVVYLNSNISIIISIVIPKQIIPLFNVKNVTCSQKRNCCFEQTMMERS